MKEPEVPGAQKREEDQILEPPGPYAERNLELALNAIKKTREALPFGPANQGIATVANYYRNGDLNGFLEATLAWMMRRIALKYNGGKLRNSDRVVAVDKYARDVRTGGCMEFSAVAFIELAKLCVNDRIEWVKCIGRDHQFVVIAREGPSTAGQVLEPLGAPNTWGGNAVVCDAWANQVFIVSTNPEFEGMRAKAKAHIAEVVFQRVAK